MPGGKEGRGGPTRPRTPVQSVALTEAGLWPYRGESCRGEWGARGWGGCAEADGWRRQHWALLFARQPPPAYGQSIRSLWRRKKKSLPRPKKSEGWKSTSHSVWKQVVPNAACVTPSFTGDIVKRLSAR